MSPRIRFLFRSLLPFADARGLSSATRSLRRLLGWVGLAFAVVALAACGAKASAGKTSAAEGSADVASRASAPSATGATDASLRGIVTSRKACDLLKRPDAEAAVGQPLPQNTVNATLGVCDFNAADFSAGASLTVGSWESVRGAAISGLRQAETIGGVGDEALNLNGSNGSILYVRRGTEGFLLTLNGPKIDPLKDHGLAQEKDLAIKVLRNF